MTPTPPPRVLLLFFSPDLPCPLSLRSFGPFVPRAVCVRCAWLLLLFYLFISAVDVLAPRFFFLVMHDANCLSSIVVVVVVVISPVKPIKSSVWGIIDLHIRRYIRLKTMVSCGTYTSSMAHDGEMRCTPARKVEKERLDEFCAHANLFHAV